MNTCKVLVADDHELILTSIRSILVNKFSINSDNISVFTSSGQVLDEIKNVKYDLYILDLEFQELSGFDLIQSIREKDCDARIIICTMHQEVWNINRLLDADVDGVILKNSANMYLEQAINCVTRGGKFLCPRFKEIQYKSQAYKNKIKKHVLTDREKEVLKLVVNGHSSKEIATLLDISENGVEKHRKNLFLKLDVENVVQLVRVAIYHRLIEI
jgi:DNA-binding NarL/FixJ family response regulator